MRRGKIKAKEVKNVKGAHGKIEERNGGKERKGKIGKRSLAEIVGKKEMLNERPIFIVFERSWNIRLDYQHFIRS